MYAIQRKRSGAGCSSEFYKLVNNDCGFKAFDNYELAQIAHYTQSKLAEHDLAPKVYSEVGRVRIGNTKKLSKWGYITEIAELVCCAGNSCSCCDREDIEDALHFQICDLVDNIEEIGFYFGDSHPGNVGYVNRDGNMVLVCIDTGDESVGIDENGPCFCLECKKGGNCRG